MEGIKIQDYTTEANDALDHLSSEMTGRKKPTIQDLYKQIDKPMLYYKSPTIMIPPNCVDDDNSYTSQSKINVPLYSHSSQMTPYSNAQSTSTEDWYARNSYYPPFPNSAVSEVSRSRIPKKHRNRDSRMSRQVGTAFGSCIPRERPELKNKEEDLVKTEMDQLYYSKKPRKIEYV